MTMAIIYVNIWTTIIELGHVGIQISYVLSLSKEHIK